MLLSLIGGARALNTNTIRETLVSLYLRLNGYFVSGFIVHAPQNQRTEMDALAVRFPLHMEPERQVSLCQHLGVPDDRIDFIVGEVKGGSHFTFNSAFRENPEAIRTVLQRFGAFDDREIGRVCETVPHLLEPMRLRRDAAFPELDVTLAEAIGSHRTKLRFVLFAPELSRSSRASRPFVFGDDLLAFVWNCFRPEQQRPECDWRYDFKLWGPQFTDMVQYFKDREQTSCGTIQDLYDAMVAC